MSALFEELDYRVTPIGALSLRRRRELRLGVDILEIKLGEEHLMSDLFTASEIALADLGLEALSADGRAGTDLDVVVGGLGLGYTAQAVLAHDSVGSLIVVDALEAVIDWHKEGVVPLGAELTADERCRFVHGDFFGLAASEEGFDPQAPGRRFDAVLVDIDHSPDFLLDPNNAGFYGVQGLTRFATHMKPGGIFGLWSNEFPDARFVAVLGEVFDEVRAKEVTFDNPYQDVPVTQTVYLAHKR